MNETNDTPEDRDDDDASSREESDAPEEISEEHNPRTGPLTDDEVQALENTIRAEIQSHLDGGGLIGTHSYGVRAGWDDDDKVYSPIIGDSACILGILVIGHVMVIDVHSTVREVYNLRCDEIDALETGWMFGHKRGSQDDDSRCFAIGAKLQHEFNVNVGEP